MAQIIIPDEVTYQDYTVGAAQTAFPFSFAIFSKADLRFSVAGVELLQTDFTLVGTILDGGGYQGGTIVLNTPVTNVICQAWRLIAPVRTANFAPAPAAAIRDIDLAFNRAMALDQDERRDISRAIMVPIGQTPPTYAQLGANFKGDPGGNIMATGLFSALSAQTIPAGANRIITTGNSVAGLEANSYTRETFSDFQFATNMTKADATGAWFRLDQQASVQRASAAAGLVAKLTACEENVTVAIYGDSTGYDSVTPPAGATFDPAHAWPRLLLQKLAAEYPKYAVSHYNWTFLGLSGYVEPGAWAAPVSVSAGAPGTYSLKCYDGSVPGTLESYPYASRWAAMVTGLTPAPSLSIVNLGHNLPDSNDALDRFTNLIQSLKAAQPATPILVMCQYWGTNSPDLKRLISARWTAMSQQMGFDIWDWGMWFENNGGQSLPLTGDGTHETILGHEITADGLYLQKFRRPALGWLPTVSLPSSYAVAAKNYLPDPQFQLGLGGGSLANRWRGSAGDVVLTQQSTYFETNKGSIGRAARLQSNGNAEKYISLSLTPVPPELLGQECVLAVRMRRPLVNAIVNRQGLRADDDSGNIGISNDQIPSGDAQDGFFWKTLSFKVSPTATFLLLQINVAFTGSTALGDVVLDRAGLFLGRLPRDSHLSPTGSLPTGILYTALTGHVTLDLGGLARAGQTLVVSFSGLTASIIIDDLTNVPENSIIYLVNRDTGGKTVTMSQTRAVLPGGVAAVLGQSDVIGLIAGPVYLEGISALAANS